MENEKAKFKVIIKNGDSISICPNDEYSDEWLEVKNVDGKLVYEKKVKLNEKDQAKEDIRLEKLIQVDDWISEFVESHTLFKNIATSSNGIMDKMQVLLSVCNVVDPNFKKIGKHLELTLYKDFRKCYTGATLDLYNENEDEFKYIFAWVLDYYLLENYGNRKVDAMLFELERRLNTGEPERTITGERILSPVLANLFLINTFGDEYIDIANTLIYNHNKGISSKYLLDELRSKITGEKHIHHNVLKESIKETKGSNDIIRKSDYSIQSR
jgi:hypothetical protein